MMEEGKVVLGGVMPDLPGTKPGWAVEPTVTSRKQETEYLRGLIMEYEATLDANASKMLVLHEFIKSEYKPLVDIPHDNLIKWVVDECKALSSENALLKSRVDPSEESKRITALSESLQEDERLRGLVRRAFSEGFNYGVRLRMENDGNAVIFDTKINEAWEQSDVRVMV